MKTPKDFKCSRCGSCCHYSPFLTKHDISRIKKAGYSEDFFVEDWKGEHFMKMKNSKCVFLGLKGKEFYCKIYESRPKACMEYPIEVRENGDCRPSKSF